MESRQGTAQPVERFVPAYGPIEAVLGYGFFYFLVHVGTPVVQAAVADSGLGIEPSLIGWAAAVALWAILLLTLLGQATEQASENPRRYEDLAAARRGLDALAPSMPRMQAWSYLWVVGMLIAVFGIGVFLESFRALLSHGVVLLDSGFQGTVFTPEFVWFVVYTIAFSLVTRYTDRLILGWYRRRLVAGLRTG